MKKMADKDFDSKFSKKEPVKETTDEKPKLLDLPKEKDEHLVDVDDLPRLHEKFKDGPTETSGEHAGMHTVGNDDEDDTHPSMR